MPLLKIETNTNFSDKQNLIKKLSVLISELTGKPEKWVMIVLNYNPDMMFGGKTEPLIYAELKSIGLPEQKTPEITGRLMEFLKHELSVTPDRMYIEYSNARPEMWGWNMDTF